MARIDTEGYVQACLERSRKGRPGKKNLLSAYYLRVSAAKILFVYHIQQLIQSTPSSLVVRSIWHAFDLRPRRAFNMSSGRM